MKERLSDTKLEVPEVVLDYLQKKHFSILRDYRTPDGKYPEHCGLIAIEIKPYIMIVSEDVYKGGISSRVLEPLLYRGKVRWGAHQVCCCDGQAFDPILGKPIAIEDYTKAAFGVDIRMKVLISSEQVKKLILTTRSS